MLSEVPQLFFVLLSSSFAIMEIFQVCVIRSMSFFFISFILLSADTSHAQLEDYSLYLDSSVAALPTQDETNFDISVINDSLDLGIPSSNLFTTDNLDDSLFSTSLVADILVGGDESNLDLFASAADGCSPDSNPRVNRRQACQSNTNDLKSSTENGQAQPGALTPKIIANLIRNVPYGIELSIESDYAWCDPTLQRKYAICDSGFSYDRIPHFTSILADIYDLYDSSPCAFFCLLFYSLALLLLPSQIFTI